MALCATHASADQARRREPDDGEPQALRLSRHRAQLVPGRSAIQDADHIHQGQLNSGVQLQGENCRVSVHAGAAVSHELGGHPSHR